MKIVSFSPGLGNQIFQYSFYLYLKNNFPNHKIYGYYNKKWLNKHNGLEIQRVFKIELPRSSFLTNLIIFFLRIYRKYNKSTKLACSDNYFNLAALFFDGYWQQKVFMLKEISHIAFTEIELNEENCNILKLIQNNKSVSIHIRRGDYLLPEYYKRYGNICTIEYYYQAIDFIKGKLENPTFFFFSDDVEWVKKQFNLEHSFYISWNKGQDSFIDLFMMTHCNANIIANSTFSFWGAYMNKTNNNLVVYPKKWFNNAPSPNIFNDTWIAL